MSFPATASTSDCAAELQPSLPTDDLVKTVLVEIRGTPPTFASVNGSAAQWSIPPATATQVFGPSVSAGLSQEVTDRMLRNVMLRKVRPIEGKTNAQDIIGLQIHGLPKSEYTTTGDDHHVLMLGAGKTKHLDVFNSKGDVNMGVQWMMEYPEYNQDNIRSHPSVMRLNGSNYYFVREDHPVVKMLYKNQEDLGTSISHQDKVNGQYYSVDHETFEDACNSLDHNVFSNLPQIFDLTNLTMRIRRPDNRGWLDPPTMHDAYLAADKETKKKIYKQYMDTPIYLVAKLEFHYSLLPLSAMQGL